MLEVGVLAWTPRPVGVAGDLSLRHTRPHSASSISAAWISGITDEKGQTETSWNTTGLRHGHEQPVGQNVGWRKHRQDLTHCGRWIHAVNRCGRATDCPGCRKSAFERPILGRGRVSARRKLFHSTGYTGLVIPQWHRLAV